MTVLDYGKKCVVIDLDETLVHSSFKVGRHKDRQPSLCCVCRRVEAYGGLRVASCREETPVTVAY